MPRSSPTGALAALAAGEPAQLRTHRQVSAGQETRGPGATCALTKAHQEPTTTASLICGPRSLRVGRPCHAACGSCHAREERLSPSQQPEQQPALRLRSPWC